MSDELEIAAMASAGALKGAPPDARKRPEDACDNCDTVFVGKFCPECGQLAADFHRPILSMLGNVLGDTFALDGRLARTIPALIFRPGKVTRAYLEGRRARYVPPFRLFLVSSLLFFSTLFMLDEQQNWTGSLELQVSEDGGVNLTIDEGDNDETNLEEVVDPAQPIDADDIIRDDGTIDPETLSDLIAQEMELNTAETREATGESVDAISENVGDILEDPRLFIAAIKDWAPRLSLLMFPIFAIFLTLLYVWHRRVFVYDHLVTSLHFQSFLYLSGTVLMLLGFLVGGWAGLAFGLLTPVYLYRLLRKTYGTGRFMAFLRTGLLLLVSFIAMSGLIVAMAIIGYLQV
ncbi:MAG: DUF3667 domain-containing protein [Hyphomonadaceae bacterium]